MAEAAVAVVVDELNTIVSCLLLSSPLPFTQPYIMSKLIEIRACVSFIYNYNRVFVCMCVEQSFCGNRTKAILDSIRLVSTIIKQCLGASIRERERERERGDKFKHTRNNYGSIHMRSFASSFVCRWGCVCVFV
jgi:hypothetical protein